MTKPWNTRERWTSEGGLPESRLGFACQYEPDFACEEKSRSSARLRITSSTHPPTNPPTYLPTTYLPTYLPILNLEGSGFRVQGSGCMVQGSGFRGYLRSRIAQLRAASDDLQHPPTYEPTQPSTHPPTNPSTYLPTSHPPTYLPTYLPIPNPQGSGFRVQGSGFRLRGSGFRVQGSGFRA